MSIMNNQPATTPATEITLFQPQNMQTLAQLAPQSHLQNTKSHAACLARGRQLLDRVRNEGMSDNLDRDLEEYIRLTKITLKKMNTRRTPVTQLFDLVRKAYTTLENEVDPAKSGTIPFLIQQQRNLFAQKKHEEEERRHREEEARLAKENARKRYRADVEDDYSRQFNALVNNAINQLSGLDRQITLDNFNAISERIKNYNCQLPDNWCLTITSTALRPAELSPGECRNIQTTVINSLKQRFTEQFPFEVQTTRDDILDRLPSKKKELEHMAKASAEEAAAIKARLEAKEREEAARKEAERLEREKQEAAAARLAAEKQEMDSLFGAPVAAQAEYRPKTQLKKKVIIQTPDDIMAIVAFWWSQVGSTLSIQELSKEFKKQITFANSAANSKNNPVFISNVRYEDEVKAK